MIRETVDGSWRRGNHRKGWPDDIMQWTVEQAIRVASTRTEWSKKQDNLIPSYHGQFKIMQDYETVWC